MPRTDALQAPRSVATIRPHRFFPNGETAADTACQKASGADPDTIAARALAEFDSAVETLRTHGVEVHVFEDDGSRDTPDPVFPNNWLSTHPGGQIAPDSLTAEQKARITPGAEIAALQVPTIELAAGSARCMIAGVHLARRSQPLKD